MTMSDKSRAAPHLYLGEFELLVLLAIVRIGPVAYGVTIRDELERETSREVTLGAVYKTLGRLEQKGYVDVRIGAPTAERGGRRKKLYHLQPLGTRALRESLATLRRLTRSLGRELEAL
jgi:PadR family transcriptional regulator, regulatory protein PadR